MNYSKSFDEQYNDEILNQVQDDGGVVVQDDGGCGFGLRSGFTLIELLVVVLIIGILTAIALPQYQKAVQKSRAAEAWTIGKSLSDAASVYYLQEGTYEGINVNNIDVTVNPQKLKNFSLVIGGGYVYEPTHMDIMLKNSEFRIVWVHLKGRVYRKYCKAHVEKGIEICKYLGATSCTKINTECKL